MRRTRIKICGVMRVEDAARAAAAGADAIGMVFYRKARRYISPEQAGKIIQAIPPFVTPVGLFVDAPAVEVRNFARSLGLRHVQLHGHEDPNVVRQLEGFAVLKVVRVAKATFRQELDVWRAAIAAGGLAHLRGLILDTAGDAPGGAGVANDWETVSRAIADGTFEGLPPLIAAGGLTPENVGAVQAAIRPWAVDVSSGVEAVFGQKSGEKIDALVAAVRDGDARL